MSHHPKGKKQILLTEAAFVPSFHTNLVCIQKLNDKGVYWNNKERRLLEANSRNGQLNEESLLKDQHLILNRRTVQRNVLGGDCTEGSVHENWGSSTRRALARSLSLVTSGSSE